MGSFILALFMIVSFVLGLFVQRYISRPHSDRQEMIQTLIRQCSRWSTASTQDENPVIAYLHASYAVAYLYALDDLFLSNEIESASGIDFIKFRKELQKNQDIALQKGIKAYPELAKLPKNSSVMISQIAGEI